MGRPPAENPRNVQIAFRVDQGTADALDQLITVERRPGEVLSRNDMARMLLFEALAVRTQRGTKRSK